MIFAPRPSVDVKLTPTSEPSRTPLTPPCPQCHRIDDVEEEEQTGSSGRSFVCERCGIRYTTPPRVFRPNSR
jgi:hypothetical protein